MRKFIITENQFRKMINLVVSEQHMLDQDSGVLSLNDLAELLSRTGYEYDTLLEVLHDVFRCEGHEGVVNFFNKGTHGDIEIEYLAHGLYTLKMPNYEKIHRYRNSD